jgi:uncharacterized RDD family membrane protein YckC
MSIDDSHRAVPVGFEDRLSIATPEGVELELTLANIGSRFIAGLLDGLIQFVGLFAIGVVFRAAGGVGAAIGLTIDFLLIFFYHVLFEVLGGGRTPGKRWTGLRVVRAGGAPVTFVRSALRNILRIIDFPVFYLVGMITIFITTRNQRLGDLAAGTYVVRDRHGDRSRGQALSELPNFDPGPAVNWDVSGVSADDVATVRAFLDRRFAIDARARVALAAELANRLRPLVGGGGGDSNDERFLEMLVAAKARRSG